MAVAVDYSLFYLKREREERARGAGKLAALEAAAATSGHAVLVSGLTVMASLAGIFFLGEPESGAMAIGSILVVGVAVLGSLTVLPAVLAKLGDWVHQRRLPLLRRLKRGSATPAAGASSSATSCAAPSSRSPPASQSSSSSPFPPWDAHQADRPDDLSRKAFPVLKVYDHIRPSRATGARHRGGLQAPDGTSPVMKAGSPRSSARRWPPARCSARSPSPRSAATAPTRRSICRRRGRLERWVPWTRWHACGKIAPATVGHVPGTTVDVGGDAATTNDANDNLSMHARSCSASCSRWRSCSCSSRSGRS